MRIPSYQGLRERQNTQEILRFVYEFAKQYFSSEHDNTDIPIVKPEAAGNSGSRPFVKHLTSIADEVGFILRCLKKWHTEGRRASARRFLDLRKNYYS